MKTIAIIAEFNPFHNGHRYLIDHCKKVLDADNCIILMSGDFVQRGAPAIVDKFARTRMALSSGADVVLELPVYYSVASAEYFARGAVAILDSLNCVDYLCFGSECGNICSLTTAAELLNNESENFKNALSQELQKGLSYPAARSKALSQVSSLDNKLLSAPNNILGIEYIRSLLDRKSNIIPFTIARSGESYDSNELNKNASATGIRNAIFTNHDLAAAGIAMPDKCHEILANSDHLLEADSFSELLRYKLLLEMNNGYEKYLDVSEDFSNRIISSLNEYKDFDSFSMSLKTKNLTYSRISRCLLHILLNITKENMEKYKEDNFTSYARILGIKESASSMVRLMKEKSDIPVIFNLKEANMNLSPLRKQLLDETLISGYIYRSIASSENINEYKLKPLIQSTD